MTRHFNKALVGLLLPMIFFACGLFTINDFGEIQDEKFDQAIGNFYFYEWNTRGLDGLTQTFGELQRNYGPAFNIAVVATHEWLHTQLGIVKESVAAYHVATLVAASLLVYLTFLFTYQRNSLEIAILASALLALMPRYLGDSQANLKDTPLAFFFGLTLYLSYRARQRLSMRLYILAGASLGLTYAIKINAILVPVILGSWLFLTIERAELTKPKFYLGGLAGLGAAFAVILLVWPYYRYDTFARFPETYRIFKEHTWNEEVLYFGTLYRGKNMPWHFPFVMLTLTTPIFVLVGMVLHALLPTADTTPDGRRFDVLLCLWIFIPLAAQAFSGAPMYDGVRHYLLVLPAVAALSARGFGVLVHHINEIRVAAVGRRLASYLVLVLGLGHLVHVNWSLHPYQVVFFNSVAGGLRAAQFQFDLDYWGLSLKEAAKWLNGRAAPGSSIFIPYGIHHTPLRRDLTATAVESISSEYKMIVLRGMQRELDPRDNYLAPFTSPVHEVKIGGVPLLRIFFYPGRAQIVHPEISEGLPRLPEGFVPGLQMQRFANALFEHPVDATSFEHRLNLACQAPYVLTIPENRAYSAWLQLETSGVHCLSAFSDDDLSFSIQDQIVLKAPSLRRRSREIFLNKGFYPVRLLYSNHVGPGCLELTISAATCVNSEVKGKEPLFFRPAEVEVFSSPLK